MADEFAGRRARCPVCQTVYTVPALDAARDEWGRGSAVGEANSSFGDGSAAGSVEGSRDETWYLRAHDGQVYGPVDRTELEAWVAEGRVDAQCQLRNDRDLGWVPADIVFPILGPGRGGAGLDRQPYSTTGFRRPADDKGNHIHADLLPHRGPLILILGICSWFLGFPVFGAIAWYMGSRDLREIRAGHRDPQGEALTRAGQILGAVHVLLFAAVLASLLLFLLLLIFGAMM